MYLAIVKATTRYWGIHDDEAGAYALQCCAAAGADMEAQGDDWLVLEAAAAFAERRKRPTAEVLEEMFVLCSKHNLPTPPEVVRFLARQAARLEAEAAAVAWSEGGTQE